MHCLGKSTTRCHSLEWVGPWLEMSTLMSIQVSHTVSVLSVQYSIFNIQHSMSNDSTPSFRISYPHLSHHKYNSLLLQQPQNILMALINQAYRYVYSLLPPLSYLIVSSCIDPQIFWVIWVPGQLCAIKLCRFHHTLPCAIKLYWVLPLQPLNTSRLVKRNRRSEGHLFFQAIGWWVQFPSLDCYLEWCFSLTNLPRPTESPL